MRMLPAAKYARIVGWRLANAAAGEHVYPFYCSFKITGKCGLRCKMCNIWKRPKKDMTTKQIFDIFDNVAKSSITVVRLCIG